MTCFVQPPNVMIQHLDGEAVLLNVTSGYYFGLDPVGSRIWNALTASESMEKALDGLLAEYQVDAESLRRDVEAFVEQLREHGLLSVHEQ